ncbi:4-(cytidine 5'-diphospho)-2-C-methyl-D-erythritol kinase [Peptacetobacter sp.]|uniref:4-(cytidine 5'-diphospho)-2-C-methyl-D-erythritol kinase n=1 Tax=Peptacetobacter sp. TaxID=2991975 RepID=UPI00261075CB|nr:4-(cytidine 5'-diphospho)-2-C-methyl-D-erythritol kinase [Peptacetobacter sp.]
MKVKCRAKINLSIDILGKLENGYHLVEMIMQSIDLYDILDINERNDGKIILTSENKEIPLDETNIIYKAATLLKEEMNIKKGAEIVIDKKIPVAAGMAGGSTDAAGTLIALNKIWKLNLDEKQLKEIGFKLGADVPFCISGGAVLAENLGEKLTNIKGLDDNLFILICKPELFVSTKEVYNKFDMSNVSKRPNNKYLIECLEKNDTKSLAKNMCNVLEFVTSSMHPEIEDIENTIKKTNVLGTMMSGSGPTVFGIFDIKEEAEKAKKELLKKYKQVYVVRSAERGIEINGESN